LKFLPGTQKFIQGVGSPDHEQQMLIIFEPGSFFDNMAHEGDLLINALNIASRTIISAFFFVKNLAVITVLEGVLIAFLTAGVSFFFHVPNLLILPLIPPW
jgi:hypothetical protein